VSEKQRLSPMSNARNSTIATCLALKAVHWVFAEDIDAFYHELKSLGANIVDPLEKKPWG
jgi:uncharacterized glyoxalase superfamily protein PhnB